MAQNHLVDHIQHHHLRTNNKLHVIGVISNTERYHSRYRLAREWMKEMLETPHVELHMVELAFGDRHFEVTEHGNKNHLQLYTNQVLWHKENMINLGVRHLLPQDWKYMAWVDCDVFFRDKGWAQETLHQLQHYPLIQPWSDCIDLGFHGNVLQHFQSFCYVHRKHERKQTHPGQPYKYAHSGFAWACTRYFWENVQGLIDFAILGSADHHMAWAAIGGVRHSVHNGMSQGFKNRCNDWQDAACRVTHGDAVGFVKGRIEHGFHGPKARRRYRERWQILIDNHFDPNTDLGYDAQGLIYLLDKPKLQEEVREYMRFRHEDSIEDWG
jgi:hypothetical protein